MCVRVCLCVCCSCCECQLSIHLHQGASNTQSPVYLSLSHPQTNTHTCNTLTGQMVVPPLPKQCNNTHTQTHRHTNEGEETVCFSCLSWSKRGWHQPCPLSIHHAAISLSLSLSLLLSILPCGDPLSCPPVTVAVSFYILPQLQGVPFGAFNHLWCWRTILN